jgi:hypothetical protein
MRFFNIQYIMKNKCLLAGFIFVHVATYAQMKIGDNSTSINSASLLELETTNKGLVFPRVSLTDVASSSPLAAGLLTGTVVFNINASTTNGNGIGLYYWNGSSWSIVTPNISSSAWSITGNANTSYIANFLGTTNNVSLRFRTNNTQRVIIDSLGKVGINTNSPSEKLDVSGNIRFSGALMPNNTAGTAGYFLVSTGANNPPAWFDASNYAWQLDGNPLSSARKFGSTTNYDIPFITNNIERMRLTAGGLLGIGTTNPGYALSVLAASNPLYLSGVQATSTFSADSVLTINAGVVKKAPYSSLTGTFWSLTGNSGTSASTNFIGTTDAIDFVAKTNSIERLRITSGGRIGIGTNAPASDLTLYQSSGSGSSKGFTFTGNSIGGTSSGTGFLMSLGYNATGNKQLWVGDADYAGNVSGSFARFGISGTSFPVLDAVSGNNASRRYLALGVAGDANSGVIFGSDNTSVNPGSQVWDNGNMSIGNGYKSSAAPTNGLLVQGNVGIGTTNPGYALSVSAINPLYLSGVQPTAAFTTDSLLAIYNGVVKEAPFSSLTSNFWSVTGNSGTNASNNFIGTTDGIDFVTKTNNIERMRILGAANGSSKEGWIGMGITPPRSSLDVTGNYTNKNVITIQNTSSTGYSSVDMLDNSGTLTGTFGYGNSGTGAFFGSRDYFSLYGHDFVLNANSGNYDFFLKGSTGYVGLNTSAPSERLDVGGNVRFSGALMPNNLAGTSGYMLTSTGAGTAPLWTNPATIAATYNWLLGGNTLSSQQIFGTLNNYPIPFYANNTEKMRLTAAGYLGIGTTNPGYTLSVLAASNPLYLSGVQATAAFTTDSLLTIYSGVVKAAPFSSLTGNFWGLTGNSGTNASSKFIGTTDAVDFVARTNNSERFRITSAGNVGINTSSPGSTLDVKGTLRLSGSTSGYVALAPAAAAGSTTYTLPSADGTAGQALVTNGSGTLSWASAAATIGTIGTGATIQGTATGKYYCTGSYITLPPGKFIVNVYMMLSSTTNPMTQTTGNQPGSFFIKSFFADASLGTIAGTTDSPLLPQSDVSSDVVGNGKLISGSLNVGQTYNPITGFVVINNTSGANKSYYYWAGWVSLTNISSTNSLPLIGGTNYGEDNIVAYPSN